MHTTHNETDSLPLGEVKNTDGKSSDGKNSDRLVDGKNALVTQGMGALDSMLPRKEAVEMPRQLACHQRFISDVRFFVGILTITVACIGMMLAYNMGVLTTTERRYNLSSRQLGSFTSINQAGTLITITLCGYFGGLPGSHRPRWIGTGTLVMSAGMLITSLPQFTLGPYVYKTPGNDSTITNATTETNMCQQRPQNSDHANGSLLEETWSCDLEEQTAADESQSAYLYLFIGALLLGVGYSPILTLGSAFVDDSTKHTSTAIYLGIINMMWGFGPIIGFIIAAGCTSVFVDINRVNMETVYLKLGDPQWIGAWWLGGAFLIPPMVICALTFWFVPKDLKKYRLKPITRKTNTNYKKDEQADKDEESLKNVQATGSGFIRSLKDFPRTLCRLVLNPYFILVTVAFAFDLGVAMGILMFLPKYLEVQFNLSSIAANATTALACTAPYGIGTFLGGYAINRFKLGEFGIAKFLVVIVGTSIIFCAMMFPFGCNSVDINGVSEMGGKNTLPCNENCHCSIGVYRPVCGSNGETYMSPCYAGCTQMNDNGSYIDCSCIKSNDTEDMHAMDGACQEGQTCPSFYIFAVILFLFAITSGAREIPAVMLTIRSVKETDKSFALAINFLLVRCLGPIPLPILYGFIIDKSCLLWKSLCHGTVLGGCINYSNILLRYNVVGISLCLKCLSFVFFVILYFMWRRKSRSAKTDKPSSISH